MMRFIIVIIEIVFWTVLVAVALPLWLCERLWHFLRGDDLPKR